MLSFVSSKPLAILLCLAAVPLGAGAEGARRSPCGPGVPYDPITGNCSPKRNTPPDTDPRRPEPQPPKPRETRERRCPPGTVLYLGTCTPKCSAGIVNNCNRPR